MAEQKFGGVWTVKKLNAVEKYIDAYIKIMKNQKFKLIYIDAFAGSGEVETKDGQIHDGSAIRALKYPFNAFRFFEMNESYCAVLEDKIKENLWDVETDYRVIKTDCNDALMKINNKTWLKDDWRGVIFLDPYSMSLSWECLEEISKTQIFDVWYLFPFMALNRNLYRDISKIPQANRDKITNILGTDEWISELYNPSSQIKLYDDEEIEKVSIKEVKQYVITRLKTIFPTVSEEAVLLKYERTNTPLFLLCFMGSNPNPKAKEASLRVANHILTHSDMERV